MSGRVGAKRATALVTAGAVATMLGLSFAAVPLYRLFCAKTGYGGTTQVAEQASAARGQRHLTVRFDGNVASGLPWRFEPQVGSVKLRTGETATIFYRVTNLSDRPTTGIASYNVSPDQAGSYFNKLACFCFAEQTLAPHETVEWPVMFFLDPALEQDDTMRQVEGLTLSYTFYAPKRPAAAQVAADKPKS